MNERRRFSPFPDDSTDHQDSPAAQEQQAHEHSEVIGLAEVLEKRDQLPVLELERRDYNFEESWPLLTVLQEKYGLAPAGGVSGCALQAEAIKQKKKFFSYRLRVPRTLFPLPELAHLEAVEWIDLDLMKLVRLQQSGEALQHNLQQVLAAVSDFETKTQLVVRGDGVVCHPG